MNVSGPISKLQAMGYIKVTNLAAAITTKPPSGARAVLFRCAVADVRWRDDGGIVTAANGMLLMPSDEPVFYTSNLGQLQFIETAINATLDLLYYG